MKSNAHVGIVTDTLYKKFNETGSHDHVRGILALDMFHVAQQRGYELIVVDGGSHPSFLDEAKKMNVELHPQTWKGMSGGRQQGYKLLYEQTSASVFVRTEPEKISFVENCLTNCIDMIESNKGDIVIPCRHHCDFATYPAYQAKSEQCANTMYNGLLRLNGLYSGECDLDMFFGPRVFSRTMIEYFMRCYEFIPKQGVPAFERINPGKYSNALFFPVVNALRDGMRVLPVTVGYTHPLPQTEIESGDPTLEQKRDQQCSGIVNELVQLLQKINDVNVRLCTSQRQLIAT